MKAVCGVTLVVLLAAQTADADGPLLAGSVRAHDPSSIVSDGGRRYVLTTGRGLRVKSSGDLTRWDDEPPVFKPDGAPPWIEDQVPGFRESYWAPDIVRVGDRYRVYYSASRFGKQASAIGLVSNKSLDPSHPDFAWKDEGVVVSSEAGDPYNAIDPSVLIDQDGRHWMAFGSFWQGIYLLELDPGTGLALTPEAPKTRLAHAESIEAPTLLRRGDWCYLFVNHGLCCRGVNSTYRILVGRSRQVTGPYLDREGVDLVDGGGAPVLATDGPRIGPGHVAPFADAPHDRFAFHYYDGDQQGRSKLALASWEWSDDGWPSAVDVRLAGPEERPRRRRATAP